MQQAEAVCASRHPESSDTSVTKGRNRQETRTADVFSTARAMAETEWSSLIKRFVRVTRDVSHRSAKTGLWSSTSEVACYVANSTASARQAGNAIRGHWHIENTLHYTRDVIFGEDRSRVWHNPAIFARIRSFAYTILQRNRTSTFSQEQYAAALGGLDALLKLRFS